MIITSEISADLLRRSEAQAIDLERRRIAHELHDGVAQRLGALRFRAALWHPLADGDRAGMHDALDELQDELNAVIADIRSAIFAVRPAQLNELGFLPALRQWVTGFAMLSRLATEVDASGLHESLPQHYELPLLRVIQESLSNVRQHARASAALVCLASDTAGIFAVTVSDNGQGFDPGCIGPPGQAGHFGLSQMRERIRDLGGTMDVRSAVGQGTQIVVTLPRAASAAGAIVYTEVERRKAFRRLHDLAGKTDVPG
jgi:signal transduction histidine kinase